LWNMRILLQRCPSCEVEMQSIRNRLVLLLAAHAPTLGTRCTLSHHWTCDQAEKRRDSRQRKVCEEAEMAEAAAVAVLVYLLFLQEQIKGIILMRWCLRRQERCWQISCRCCRRCSCRRNSERVLNQRLLQSKRRLTATQDESSRGVCAHNIRSAGPASATGAGA